MSKPPPTNESTMSRWAQKLWPGGWRRWVSTAVLLLFVGAAVVVIVQNGRELLAYPLRLNGQLVLLSFVVECTGLLLAIPVWQQIMTHFDGRVSYQTHFRIYCYSMLGIALPGRIWSVVGRAALYEREGVPSLRVATASAVEFVMVGLAGLLVYGVTTVIYPTESIWQRPEIAIVLIFMALLLMQPPLFNRVVHWVLQRSQTADTPVIQMGYLALIRWLVLESVVIVIGGTAVYILLYSFIAVSIEMFLPVLSAWAAAIVAGTLFFWLPGPVIRDGTMTLVLTQALPTATAFLFAILVRVWTIASILALVAIVWFWHQYQQFRGNQANSRGIRG